MPAPQHIPSLFSVGDVLDCVTQFTELRCGAPIAPRVAWRAVSRGCAASVAHVAEQGASGFARTGVVVCRDRSARNVVRAVHIGGATAVPAALAMLFAPWGHHGDFPNATSITQATELVFNSLGDGDYAKAHSVLDNVLTRPAKYMPRVTTLKFTDVNSAVTLEILLAVGTSERAMRICELAIDAGGATSSFWRHVAPPLRLFENLTAITLGHVFVVHALCRALRGMGRLATLHAREVVLLDDADATLASAAVFGEVVASRPALGDLELVLCEHAPLNVSQAKVMDAIGRKILALRPPLQSLVGVVPRPVEAGMDIASETHAKLFAMCGASGAIFRWGPGRSDVATLVHAAQQPLKGMREPVEVGFRSGLSVADLRKLLTETVPGATRLHVAAWQPDAVECATTVARALQADEHGNVVAPQLVDFALVGWPASAEDTRQQLVTTRAEAVLAAIAAPRWSRLNITLPEQPNAAVGRALLRCTGFTSLSENQAGHILAALTEDPGLTAEFSQLKNVVVPLLPDEQQRLPIALARRILVGTPPDSMRDVELSVPQAFVADLDAAGAALRGAVKALLGGRSAGIGRLTLRVAGDPDVEAVTRLGASLSSAMTQLCRRCTDLTQYDAALVWAPSPEVQSREFLAFLRSLPQ